MMRVRGKLDAGCQLTGTTPSHLQQQPTEGATAQGRHAAAASASNR
jgi:hypothetical protein